MPKKLDISKRDFIELAWLNLGKDLPDCIDLPESFEFSEEGKDKPMEELLLILANPDNFYFTVKHIFNIELLPFQLCILKELWTKKYPMLIATRGAGKSFMLALYALLKAFLQQGSKVVLVGSGFRQSKMLFEYCERIYENAPIFRSICTDKPRRDVDKCSFTVGQSTIIAIPVGDGSKIRGYRATCIIADEFASISESIYEVVIAGFGAVSSTPVQDVKDKATIKLLREMEGLPEGQKSDIEDLNVVGNQSIIAGTASYGFQHFAKYWKRYKAFIESKGDPDKLKEYFPDGIDPSFNYKDYSVIRLPVTLLPDGFMDEKNVSRSKATVHSGIFNMEYGACFINDSNGFFKRSLIESCITNEPINGVQFHAELRGSPRGKYVFGVDPASEQDNFSIVVLEIHENHRRIVYSWTTTRTAHKERVKNGLIREEDFYGFCARKIRDLMKVFPCERIVLDSQGGGVAVEEALHDPDKFDANSEQPIWPIVVEGEEKDTDDNQGLHILELVNFAKAEWVSNANHGLRKDLEDRILLFPFFDPLSIEFAIEDDKKKNRLYDTLEDCVLEIEELKDELATIVHTQTGTSGRDRWDTPEVKLPGGKKGRLRKDRYSALLMANMSARILQRTPEETPFKSVGGFSNRVGNNAKSDGGKLYDGPAWFTVGAGTYTSVRRRGV